MKYKNYIRVYTTILKYENYTNVINALLITKYWNNLYIKERSYFTSFLRY